MIWPDNDIYHKIIYSCQLTLDMALIFKLNIQKSNDFFNMFYVLFLDGL